jgi:hypothetical protein
MHGHPFSMKKQTQDKPWPNAAANHASPSSAAPRDAANMTSITAAKDGKDSNSEVRPMQYRKQDLSCAANNGAADLGNSPPDQVAHQEHIATNYVLHIALSKSFC